MAGDPSPTVVVQQTQIFWSTSCDFHKSFSSIRRGGGQFAGIYRIDPPEAGNIRIMQLYSSTHPSFVGDDDVKLLAGIHCSMVEKSNITCAKPPFSLSLSPETRPYAAVCFCFALAARVGSDDV